MSENTVDNYGYLRYTVNQLDAKTNDSSEVKDGFNLVLVVDNRGNLDEEEFEFMKERMLDICRTVLKNSPDAKIYVFRQS